MSTSRRRYSSNDKATTRERSAKAAAAVIRSTGHAAGRQGRDPCASRAVDPQMTMAAEINASPGSQSSGCRGGKPGSAATI